ncbi:MAG: ATP-binding cassette domain-containing protein [Chloroherpetonaceae bacterium]|nr:ATP-binding cassette domain-containing protein [Chloroherpetonaceae bacterium]MDW8437612.1 ATP-binding cassette domain-containing protein [Chloroherpetonaceae bacterium]
MTKDLRNSPDLLVVKNLRTWFPIRKGFFSKIVGYVKAVDDVSFTIKKGETLGLVGESGCGKTTTGRSILRLIEPTGGSVLFDGKDVLKMDKAELRKLRKDMQIIFQDPFSSLNPRLTVGQTLREVLEVHEIAEGEAAQKQAGELLEIVGLRRQYYNRYPHEFSGGQRQRIGIARALAVKPKFIVCDEPVSALDVSIQSQIINLLMDLQKEFGLTYLFISHSLSVVEHISDRVAVMYLGKIVEIADYKDLYENPKHPYAEALLSAAPEPDPKRKKQRIILAGDIPSPAKVPSGCYFHPRCPKVQSDCKTLAPLLAPIDGNPAHEVSCLLYPTSVPKSRAVEAA